MINGLKDVMWDLHSADPEVRALMFFIDWGIIYKNYGKCEHCNFLKYYVRTGKSREWTYHCSGLATYMEKPTIHALLPVPVAFCHQCGICYGYDE